MGDLTSLSPSEWAVLGALGLYVMAKMKRSRPDGDWVRQTHPYRRMMQVIMPTRNESVVYMKVDSRAEKLLAYLEKAGPRFGATLTHVAVASAAIGLAENPKLNRFISGGRVYQRRGRYLTFSMKRKKLDPESKVSVVKMRMEDEDTFRDLCARTDKRMGVERSDKKTHADKEYALFDLLPQPVLQGAAWCFRWLDYHGLLPGSFIKSDGLYTSVFIANIGSLEIGSVYHHLYEWGNCPFFMVLGTVEDRPVVENGEVVVAKYLPVKVAFDERIEDGLTGRKAMWAVKSVLEDPESALGCLEDDGSDAFPMARPDRPGAP